MNTSDDALIARVKAKVRLLEKGEPIHPSEEFNFDNFLCGMVVKRWMDSSLDQYSFDVSFYLNGMPIHVTVPQMSEVVRQSSRDEAMGALYKAMAEAIAATLMEEAGRSGALHGMG